MPLWLCLGTGVLAISCAATFVRLALGQGMPVTAIASWRLIFTSILLWPYAFATHRAEMRTVSRQEAKLLVASGVLMGLHFLGWIGSLHYTSVASSVVLVSMGPVFIVLGSWLFLREQPTIKISLGIFLAIIGSIIIGWGDHGQGARSVIGDLLALGGALCVAGYLIIGRKVRARLSLVTYIAFVYGIGMITLTTIVLLARQPMLGFSLKAYGWVLLLALLPQLIGHTSLNWALGHMSATFVSIITLTEPIGTSLLAYLVLREQITLTTLVGAVPVLLGVAIASHKTGGQRDRGGERGE